MTNLLSTPIMITRLPISEKFTGLLLRNSKAIQFVMSSFGPLQMFKTRFQEVCHPTCCRPGPALGDIPLLPRRAVIMTHYIATVVGSGGSLATAAHVAGCAQEAARTVDARALPGLTDCNGRLY